MVEDYFLIHKSQTSWEYYGLLCVINNSCNILNSIGHVIGQNTTMKPWKHNNVILGRVTVQCCCNHGDTAQAWIKDNGGNEILI